MSTSTRRLAAMMLGGMAIAAQAACGTTADPPTAEAQLVVSSVEDLVQGCDDLREGYPDAAMYSGEGPHPVVIFTRDLVSNLSLDTRPAYALANNSEGSGTALSAPASPRDAALLACGTSNPGDQKLTSCEFGSIVDTSALRLKVPVYSQTYTFTVYELRTGRVVDTLHHETQTKNPHALCPVTLDNGITKLYGKAQSLELTELFDNLMTTPKER